MTTRTRRISVRAVVAVLIIAVHVLLVIAFVPFVRIELPAFVVTEVSLSVDPAPAPAPVKSGPVAVSPAPVPPVEVAEPVLRIDDAPAP